MHSGRTHQVGEMPGLIEPEEQMKAAEEIIGGNRRVQRSLDHTAAHRVFFWIHPFNPGRQRRVLSDCARVEPVCAEYEQKGHKRERGDRFCGFHDRRFHRQTAIPKQCDSENEVQDDRIKLRGEGHAGEQAGSYQSPRRWPFQIGIPTDAREPNKQRDRQI